MGQNIVQFQRGLGMEKFHTLYGTEEQCIRAVHEMRWTEGFECAECGHLENYKKERQGRLLICQHCYHKTYLTAGTIFQNSKLPLRKWFLAMHLLTKNKQGIAALQLMRELSVSYETAWSLKQKLMVVMEERISEKKLQGDTVVDDVYMGGKHTGGKRGRGSENKVPVVVALSLTRENKPDQVQLRVLKGFTGEALKSWAKQNLKKGSRLFSDGLACFRAVSQVGVQHHPTVMSSDLSQRDKGCFQWVNIIIGNMKTALLGTYHHVSEKYLNRYLAEFEYRFNRRYKLKEMIPRLLYAALKTLPIPEPLLTLTS